VRLALTEISSTGCLTFNEVRGALSAWGQEWCGAMAERRTELRMVPAQAVHVVLTDGSGLRLGTLLDLSLSGARIQILSPMRAGRKLELFFDEQQQRFQCTVIWASETEIGVRFDLPVTQPALRVVDGAKQ
jgi:hypothetical protein